MPGTEGQRQVGQIQKYNTREVSAAPTRSSASLTVWPPNADAVPQSRVQQRPGVGHCLGRQLGTHHQEILGTWLLRNTQKLDWSSVIEP